MDAEATAILEKVGHALAIVTPAATMHSHTTWVVNEMLDSMTSDMLTPLEMMTLAVVLAGANDRRSPAPGPFLRLLSAEPTHMDRCSA